MSDPIPFKRLPPLPVGDFDFGYQKEYAVCRWSKRKKYNRYALQYHAKAEDGEGSRCGLIKKLDEDTVLVMSQTSLVQRCHFCWVVPEGFRRCD